MIGNLRHRVELVGIGRIDDGAGGYTRSDTVAATVWADIKPVSWSQQMRAERLEQRITHVITIRWRADLASGFGPEARVRFQDKGGRVRELSVQTVVDPKEQRRWLELQCLEGGPL